MFSFDYVMYIKDWFVHFNEAAVLTVVIVNASDAMWTHPEPCQKREMSSKSSMIGKYRVHQQSNDSLVLKLCIKKRELQA